MSTISAPPLGACHWRVTMLDQHGNVWYFVTAPWRYVGEAVTQAELACDMDAVAAERLDETGAVEAPRP